MDIYLVQNEKSGSFDKEACAILHDHGNVINVDLDDLDQIPNGARVIAAGGDGTVSVVAGYAAKHGCLFGVIPLGTGNDFARSQSIDFDTAAQVASTSENIREIDIGFIGDRAFLNHVSVGISVSANEASDGRIKEVLGPASYTVGAIVAAVREEPTELSIMADNDEIYAGALWQVTIANTGHFGGGSALESDETDNMFDLYIFEATQKLDFVKRAWGLKFSDLKSQEGVIHQTAHKVEVKASGEVTVNVDGDVYTYTDTFTCEVYKKPLKLIVSS